MLISHTTIVLTRYLVMEWERRHENDARSLGGLFLLFSDEVRDLNLKTALQLLIAFFMAFTEAKSKRDQSAVFRQLQQWISSLPNYIKGLFGQLSWSSRREPHGSRPSQIRTCPIKAYGSSYHPLQSCNGQP